MEERKLNHTMCHNQETLLTLEDFNEGMDIIYMTYNTGTNIIYYCFEYNELIEYIRNAILRPSQIYSFSDIKVVVELKISMGNFNVLIDRDVDVVESIFMNHKLFFFNKTINNMSENIYELTPLDYDFIHKSNVDQKIFLSRINPKTFTFFASPPSSPLGLPSPMIGQNDLVYNDVDSFEDEGPIRDGGFSVAVRQRIMEGGPPLTEEEFYESIAGFRDRRNEDY